MIMHSSKSSSFSQRLNPGNDEGGSISVTIDAIPAGNILIVDDTPANLRLLSGILVDRGFIVRPAPNGPLALRAIDSSPPDLIILDVNMPNMNGYEVAKQIKARPHAKDIPIIFVSALGDVEDKVRAFQAGGVDYITKPFQVEEIIARVNAHHAIRVLQKRLAQSNEALEQLVAARTSELVAVNRANERFVPREILQMLGRNNIAEVRLGDQIHREMTVLFSDIVGFTGLSETMTPQETFNFINGYLGRICSSFHTRGGVIDKYVGDEVMVLFPGRVDEAVDAAIDMQHIVAKYSRERLKKGRRPVRAGVGIHAGGLMVGIVGEEERMQGTVISDAVNTASRLQGLTRHYPCSILLSEQAIRSMQFADSFRIRFIDRVQLRGKTSPTNLYEVFDGDEQEIAAAKEATLGLYEEGLARYQAGDFKAARERFCAVTESNPSDLVAQMYVDRATSRIENGIPDDWNGVDRVFE